MTDLDFKANNTAGDKERINSSVSEVLDPYTDLDLPSAGESATINDITKAELIDALNKVVSANSNGFTTDATYGSIGNSGELAVVQAALQMLEANPGAIDGAIGNMTRTAYETFKTNYNAGHYTGGAVPAVQLTQGLSSPEAISAMVVALGGTPAAVVEEGVGAVARSIPAAAVEVEMTMRETLAKLDTNQLVTLGNEILPAIRKAYIEKAAADPLNAYEIANYPRETSGLREAHAESVRAIAAERFDNLPGVKSLQSLLEIDPEAMSENQAETLRGTIITVSEFDDSQQRMAHVRTRTLAAPERLTATAAALRDGVYADKVSEVRASVAEFDMAMTAGLANIETLDPAKRAAVQAQMAAVYGKIVAESEIKLSDTIIKASDRNFALHFEGIAATPTNAGELERAGTEVASIGVDESVADRASRLMLNKFRADPRVADIIAANQFIAAEPELDAPIEGAPDPAAVEAAAPFGVDAVTAEDRLAQIKADSDFVYAFTDKPGLLRDEFDAFAMFVAEDAAVTIDNFEEHPVVARFVVHALAELGLDANDRSFGGSEPRIGDNAFNGTIIDSLMEFKRANGLDADGVFDVETFAKMVDQLREKGLRSGTDTWLDGWYSAS